METVSPSQDSCCYLLTMAPNWSTNMFQVNQSIFLFIVVVVVVVVVFNKASADYSSESFVCEKASVGQVSWMLQSYLKSLLTNFQTRDFSNDIIETPYGYQDNVQFLDVGSTYKYCVSSIAKNYMVNTRVHDGRSVHQSEATCISHTVVWVSSLVSESESNKLFSTRPDKFYVQQESSAKVRIVMTQEAGGLPIEGTTVDWKLLMIDHADGSQIELDNSNNTNYNKLDFVSPENGVIRIPLQIGSDKIDAFGISGQSKLSLRMWPSKESKGAFSQVGESRGEQGARFILDVCKHDAFNMSQF